MTSPVSTLHHPDDAHDLRSDAAWDLASERRSRAVKDVLRGGRTPGGDSFADVWSAFEYENKPAHDAFVAFVGEYIDEERAA